MYVYNSIGHKCQVMNSINTKMTSKVLDKLYALVLILLPKLYMSILARCDNKVCPGGKTNKQIKEFTK